MGIKRWLFLSFVGMLVVILGACLFLPTLVHALLEIMRGLYSASKTINYFIGTTLLLAGMILVIYGFRQAFISVLGGVPREDTGSIAESIYSRRCLQRGLKIVVIGGGTGLATLLKGLKAYSSNITAIVTVTDDGGSSGRLRGDLGVLPPGDIRNCLIALADKESLMEQVLQYRFKSGEMTNHSLGNLFLVALSEVSGGFYNGIQVLSKVLAIRGQVLPSTLQNATVGAVLADGAVVQGECAVSDSQQKIAHIFLEPADCQPLPEALVAIEEADVIILGPGSLYTSVITNLLVKNIPVAIKNSQALKIYVCNVMTQLGETKDYTASDHWQAIVDHGGELADYIIVNTGQIPAHLVERYQQEGANLVMADTEKLKQMGIKPVEEDLVWETDVVRHHPQKLARTILGLINGVF